MSSDAWLRVSASGCMLLAWTIDLPVSRKAMTCRQHAWDCVNRLQPPAACTGIKVVTCGCANVDAHAESSIVSHILLTGILE